MLSIGVIGSGSGSNYASIQDAIDQGRLDARVVCVISDVEDAYILERARLRGIPAFFVDCSPFKTKLPEEAEKRIIKLMGEHGADTVALAGFMRIVKKGILDQFPQSVINIHPALLPSFPGLHSWAQALNYGAKVAGCTVHFVDEGMDTGPIIVQREVRIEENDSAESLHQRIQVEEHLAYPEALQLLAEKRIKIEGRRVRIEGP